MALKSSQNFNTATLHISKENSPRKNKNETSR